MVRHKASILSGHFFFSELSDDDELLYKTINNVEYDVLDSHMAGIEHARVEKFHLGQIEHLFVE